MNTTNRATTTAATMTAGIFSTEIAINGKTATASRAFFGAVTLTGDELNEAERGTALVVAHVAFSALEKKIAGSRRRR